MKEAACNARMGAALLLGLLMMVGAVQADTPEGLSAADWREIVGQINDAREARHYAVTPAAHGFTADNPAQGFAIRYRDDGATELSTGDHRIGLRPRALGYGDALDDAAFSRPQARDASGDTLTTQWNEQLREWWVNAPAGLEQWFELAQPPMPRPHDAAPLVLLLDLDSTLQASLAGSGVDQHLQLQRGNTRIRFEKLLVFDADGRTLPAQLRLDDGLQLAYVIDDRDAPYPLTIDPTFVQQAYLKASNTDASDNFGFSVAVSGDTVVVGAYTEDSNATGVDGDQANNAASGAGAAYVFVRAGSTWSQQAYLKASNTGAGDFFGFSVAVSGDTVVVGAYREASNATGVDGDQANNAATGAGAAYVFVRAGSSWSQQAYLKASNTDAGDQFGFSVAVSGDTVVVGASREDSNATGVDGDQANSAAPDAGAAYVFVRAGSTWSQQAYLKASNTDASDLFGWSVAVSGDTVVVAAPIEDSNATGVDGDQANNDANGAGAAYVFVRAGGTWSQQAYLKASNTDASDEFGYSVAVSGDTVAVGAFGEKSNATGVDGDQANNSMSFAGAAYVFVRAGSSWSQQAYLKASNTGASDTFGDSVAVSGDTVAVGASGEDSNATGVDGDQANNDANGAGAAYVFVRAGSTWSQQAYLKASNTDAGDLFGRPVAVSGDTVVVGARGEDSNATGVDGDQANNAASGAGAAYVFELATFIFSDGFESRF
jgi:hypothetical protein